MVVGIMEIELKFYGINSLKEKRRILNPILEKIRAKYKVTIAQTGDQDIWQRVILGVAYVSNDSGHAHSVLTKVVRDIEIKSEAEVLDYSIQIV